jgi:hypothetical protein
MSINTLPFVIEIVQRLEAANLPLWVFGGWAEELWQMAPPRAHKDIDFLHPADSFEQLNQFIAKASDLQEVQPKRFSHKHAILYQHIMIEFLLVQHDEKAYFTDFFSGQYRLTWPDDMLACKVTTHGYDMPVASKQAVIRYRQNHQDVEQAYQAFLQSNRD